MFCPLLQYRRPPLPALRQSRLPAPEKGLDLDFDSFRNTSGYSERIMKDLQRVFVCLAMQDGSDIVADCGYLNMALNHAEYSKPVVMAMNSHATWRPATTLSGRPTLGLEMRRKATCHVSPEKVARATS
jgi:hypothetical protein